MKNYNININITFLLKTKQCKIKPIRPGADEIERKEILNNDKIKTRFYKMFIVELISFDPALFHIYVVELFI